MCELWFNRIKDEFIGFNSWDWLLLIDEDELNGVKKRLFGIENAISLDLIIKCELTNLFLFTLFSSSIPPQYYPLFYSVLHSSSSSLISFPTLLILLLYSLSYTLSFLL